MVTYRETDKCVNATAFFAGSPVIERFRPNDPRLKKQNLIYGFIASSGAWRWTLQPDVAKGTEKTIGFISESSDFLPSRAENAVWHYCLN